MATNDPRPTKAERREAARAKAQALREEQERREKRAKIARRSLLGVGVLAVAGVGTGLYFASNAKEEKEGVHLATAKASKSGVPSVVLSDGSWTYGKDFKPGTVNEGADELHIFFDYSCHFCAAFETLHADEIKTLVSTGALTLVLHPCKILGMDWTDMVMNAQGLVLDKAPEKSLEFHKAISALFTQIYSTQNTAMMTVENIASTAQEAGVPSSVTDAFKDAIEGNTYGKWTELGNDTFKTYGFEGTPTVYLNKTALDLSKIATATGITDTLKKK